MNGVFLIPNCLEPVGLCLAESKEMGKRKVGKFLEYIIKNFIQILEYMLSKESNDRV